MNRLPNYQIVLNALRQGTEVQIRGNTYIYEDGVLYLKLTVHNETSCDEHWCIPSELTFNEFMDECEELDEETIVGLTFQTAMSKMNNSPFNPLKWDKD